VSHGVQGTITIGGLWSVGADFAQAMLLNSVVLSVLAIGLVVFDRKAWLGPAAPETTTPHRRCRPEQQHQLRLPSALFGA